MKCIAPSEGWNFEAFSECLGRQFVFLKFDVCKAVYHHKIQINQLRRCNSFTGLLLDVHV
jgi:hypothetical protein